MKKRLFIFGAGASYDVVDKQYSSIMNSAYRPPLTKDLVAQNSPCDNLLRGVVHSTDFVRLVPRIRQQISRNVLFEDIINQLYLESASIPDRIRQLDDLSQYLRVLMYECSHSYVAPGDSNYSRLIEEIRHRKEGAVFVTFNYDTILDRDLENAYQVRYENLTHYLGSPIPLIKVHGSWNWYTNEDESGHSIRVFHQSGSRDIISDYKPAIGLPRSTGKTFIVPDHIKYLTEQLCDVTEIVIIGWRAEEEHFIQDVIQSGALRRDLSLLVVNQTEEGCRSVCTKFQGMLTEVKVKIFPGGFSKFLDNDWLQHLS